MDEGGTNTPVSETSLIGSAAIVHPEQDGTIFVVAILTCNILVFVREVMRLCSVDVNN